MYHFLEDLSQHIRFPNKELAHIGSTLRLKDTRDRFGATASTCKRQLRLVRLLRYCETEIGDSYYLAPRKQLQRPCAPSRTHDYASAPVLLYNQHYHQAFPAGSSLKRALQYHLQPFLYEDAYALAWKLYSMMTDYWPGASGPARNDMVFGSLVPSFCHSVHAGEPTLTNGTAPATVVGFAPAVSTEQLPVNSQDTCDSWKRVAAIPEVRATPVRPQRKLMTYPQCKKIFEADNVDSGSDDSDDDDALFDMEPWAIDGITVHLVHASSMDTLLVMLPVAHRNLARYTWKAFQATLARLANSCHEMFKRTAEYASLSTNSGRVIARVGNHKANDLEIAGYRVIVRQCHSDRPSFLLTYSKDSGDEIEIMHLYPAMGLMFQHEAQQVILGRIRGVGLGAALVAAARKMWSLRTPCVRNVSGAPELTSKWNAAVREIAGTEDLESPRPQGTLANLTCQEMCSAETLLRACSVDVPRDVARACTVVTQRWTREGNAPNI